MIKKKNKGFSPSQILVFGFLSFILIGAFLLTLPLATVNEEGLKLLDAIFMSTSAVCVTGLSVVDTGLELSRFGQVVIMCLIQIGGLGFMTVATMMAILLGKKITLKERLLLQEALNQNSLQGIVKLTKYIILMTFSIEFIGAVILTLKFYTEMGFKKALYFGIFHSISAFNNAGFDLLGNYKSLTDYASDWTISLVTAFLFIIGGLGFVVMADIYNKGLDIRKYSLHTKIVLTCTLSLILLGSIMFFALEYNNALKDLSLNGKIIASFYQGVTPRTAGFATIDMGGLKMSTQFIIIILMFIGASPGSTGGGIKTTTFWASLTAIFATLNGKSKKTIYGRTLGEESINKSFTIIGLGVLAVMISTMILTMTESIDFLSLLFEATSALGTVGLSVGITTKLSVPGRILIIFIMFMGRLGPLTLAFALSKKSEKAKVVYPKENIMIG